MGSVVILFLMAPLLILVAPLGLFLEFVIGPVLLLSGITTEAWESMLTPDWQMIYQWFIENVPTSVLMWLSEMGIANLL